MNTVAKKEELEGANEEYRREIKAHREEISVLEDRISHNEDEIESLEKCDPHNELSVTVKFAKRAIFEITGIFTGAEQEILYRVLAGCDYNESRIKEIMGNHRDLCDEGLK